jgi:hypothetical protein
MSWLPYPHSIMRAAFVLQLGPETKPQDNRFEGWVEEVDSGTALRFRSAEELLKFLGQRFELSATSAAKERAADRPQTPDVRKTRGKERRSK